ncbi:N-acetyltransferase [Paenibacillus sp. FSL L8-0158]|uniref:N-acetyltransferase n=1 Tax=Paenibacillus sp. FSL L8-0158 TaxID=2954752 RepID=UPI003158DFF4
MEIILVKSGLDEAAAIHEMQMKSFTPLLNIYQDFETSPANETVEQITARLSQSFTDYYIIKLSEVDVGAIRIVRKENKIYRISPISFHLSSRAEELHRKFFP